MKSDWRVRALASSWVVVLAGILPVWAGDPETTAEDQQKRRDVQFEESLGWYELFAGRNRDTALKPQPILRWTNPTRGQKGHANLVLWTGAGRPEALASAYPWNKFLVYECVSLARDEGLTAREDGRAVWIPRTAGVTFRDVPDAPVPADAPAARLVQARTIAERFKVIIKTADDAAAPRESMRLLPKPIYRYPSRDARGADPELVDGAVFAFVQGTDPEALLLVESVRHGDRTVWQYAFGRATASGVEGRLGSAVVWTAPATTIWTDRTAPAFVMARPLVD